MSDGFEIRVRYSTILLILLFAVCDGVLIGWLTYDDERAAYQAAEQLRSDTNARIVQHFTKGIRK